SQFFIHFFAKQFYQLYILPFVETTDIISFTVFTIMVNHIDRSCMIYYIQPVTGVFTITIYRQWFLIANIIDEKWYQFLGELIRTVIVGAISNYKRYIVCITIRTHYVVRCSLRSRVGRLWIISSRFKEKTCCAQ